MEASRWHQRQFGRILQADLYQTFGLTTKMCLVSLIGIDKSNILVNPPALYTSKLIAAWTHLGYTSGLPYNSIKGRFEAHHLLPLDEGAVGKAYAKLPQHGFSWNRLGKMQPPLNAADAGPGQMEADNDLRHIQLSGVYLWHVIHEGLPRDNRLAGNTLIEQHFAYFNALESDFGNVRLRRDSSLFLSRLEEFWEVRWHSANDSDFDDLYINHPQVAEKEPIYIPTPRVVPTPRPLGI